MTLPLCNEHVTMVAFTAAWCPHCKAIKPELELLQTKPQEKFHFFQFDTTDVENEQLFKDFGIEGFPTLLRFDRNTNTWQKYQGERTAEAMFVCSQTPTCGDGLWETFPQPVKTPHETERKQDEPILNVCSDHPTLLAFTGVNWCPHCVVAQPQLNALKATADSTKGFHVQQFDKVLPPQTDADKETDKIIRDFDIKSFPTFLVYDNQKKIFVRVMSLDGLETVLSDPNMLEAIGTTMNRELVWQHVPPTYHEVNCTSMAANTPNMVVFVQEEHGMQEEQEEHHASLSLDLCGTCATIIAFTGNEWCEPCKVLKSEMRLLDKHQGCGKYHFKQFDYTLNQRNENALLSEAFNIERWPTYLMFDPASHVFHHYQGPRKARDMMRWDMQHSPMWPAPLDVTINIQRQEQQQSVQATNVEMMVQTNGRLGLCAICPTILIFALRGETFVHLREQEDENDMAGYNMHILKFTDPRKHALAFELFGIEKFPTVLIYSPQLNLFFHYTKSCANLETIKAYYLRTGHKTWNVHPRVQLLK